MARTPQLVDAYGRPIERAVLTAEIAGPTLTGVRSPIGGYPADGLNPRRLAAILREADEGEPLRYFELAETIEERDLHYAGVLATRKRSVAQIEVSVEAAADDAASVAQADLVRTWLGRDALADELFDILDAIGKGVSHTEIIWDSSEGQWQPERLEWRDPRWFTLRRQDGRTPLLRTDAGDQPLPPFKFITAVIRAKSGLPIRSGIARLAAWAWMFKAFTQRDWAIFTQTYGQPIRLGKYGAGATEADKETLFRAVANIAGDCAAIVPAGMEIAFVEAKTVSEGSDLYERRSDWLDRQVSKAVLGQTTTTDAVAGGHAVSQEHRQVQEDIERADARALSAVLNRDLIRPWIDLEFGPQKAYPRLVIVRPEQEDLKLLTDSLAKLVPMGLKVEASVIRDKFGLPDPPEGAELLGRGAAPAADGARGPGRSGVDPASDVPPDPEADPEDEEDAAEAGEDETEEALQAARRSRGRDAVDRLADAAEDVAAPAADDLIDAVRAAVDAATSLEDLRQRLTNLAGDMPAERLAELMRLALLVASLEGRAEIGRARSPISEARSGAGPGSQIGSETGTGG